PPNPSPSPSPLPKGSGNRPCEIACGNCHARLSCGRPSRESFGNVMLVRRIVRLVVLLCLAAVSAWSQVTPGNCLRYNGTNGYASVPHDAALNAYPLTITAWIRTSRFAPLYDGIVNKYAPGSGNGYS